MTKYRSGNMRPVSVDEYGEPLDVRQAAGIFAARLAAKDYGKSGVVGALRQDCRTEDNRWFKYQAFIGKRQPQRYGGGIAGHDIWFSVTVDD